MTTSSNGNIFHVTGHLCGEFTGDRWIPRTKCQWRGALMFSLIWAWLNGWVNNREAGDLRRHRAHYDVTVCFLSYEASWLWPSHNKIERYKKVPNRPYVLKLSRPPCSAMLKTCRRPPSRMLPWVTMATSPDNMMVICMASVHTTALIPPWLGENEEH